MISIKTNTKLPVPPRQRHGEAVRFTPPTAPMPADPLAIPAILNRKAELEAQLSSSTTVVALNAAKNSVSPNAEAAKKALAELAEIKARKRKAKAETKKAKASDATKAMPLTGKDAEKAIKEARKINANLKKATPALARAVAKKVVAEAKPGRSLYDWEAAELKAKTGTVPPAPPFTSYGPHMKQCHTMAKAGQAKELREYPTKFTADPCPPGRKNLFRYGELCPTALKKAPK